MAQKGLRIAIPFALATLIGLTCLALISNAPASSEKKLGTVVLFLSTDCPVAARYAPRIEAISKKYQAEGFEFKAYFPNDQESASGINHYALDRNYSFSTQIDVGGSYAKSLGVKIVPTVVILDSAAKPIYIGAIDDHKDPTLVKKHYLESCLDAMKSGAKLPFKTSEPVGCVLMAKEVPVLQSKVNYAEHIKPILDRACIGCHRPGEVAPFSLIGYENAKKWAPMIHAVTKAKKMPPWKAVKGYNEFRDENRLAESEIETIHRWNEANAPRGDAKKELKTPDLPQGPWPLGTPDLILTPDSKYNLEADGADVYRHFILKTNFTDTKWVKAMAVSPGNKLVVHHVIAYLDESGKSHKLNAKDGQDGYNTFGGPGFVPDGSFGGWAPGLNVQKTPEGIAFELKPGTSVVMEVHYHKTGKPESDQTKLGLYFAKEPVVQTMALAWLAQPRIRILGGDVNSVQTMSYPIPADVTVYNAMPHMHLLGKSMRAEVEFPDGSKRPLVFVDDWDFNWQMSYMFKEPMKIPKGSTIRVSAVYDNSAANPNNPSSPPKNVGWGEQTTDEMMLLICGYTVDGIKTPRRRMMGFGDGG